MSSSSVGDLVQRVLSERLSELDLRELLAPERTRARAPDSAAAGEPHLLALEGHTQEVLCAVALSDGRLATGSRDNSIRVWQPTASVQSHKSPVESQILSGHKAGVCALATVSLEDAPSKAPVVHLVSGSLDSNVRLWDLSTRQAAVSVTLADKAVWETGELVREPARGVLLLVMSERRVRFYSLADGKRVPPELRESDDDEFSVVRVLPGAVSAAIGPAAGQSSKKKDNAFEYTLATGSYSGLVRLWRIRVGLERSGAPECECVAKLGGNGAEKDAIEGHTDAVLALAALPDGRLASASTDRSLRLWNVSIRECTATLQCEEELWDVCALRGCSRANAIAVLRADKRVQLWDVEKGDGEILDVQRISEQIESSHAFFKLLCVGANGTVYCVLRELNPDTDPNASFTMSHSGRIRLWQISPPASGRPNDNSSPLGFEDLKRVLLAFETKAHGTPVQLAVLNLTAVRLCDADVHELLHYVRALPLLTRIDLSGVSCELTPPPESGQMPSDQISTGEHRKEAKKLTTHALVRLFIGLQQPPPSARTQAQGVALAIDGRPVGWRQACEWVAGLDAELQAELVAASHTSLVESFTRALDGRSVERQQLVHMFESVLCVSDLRWPYTLLNALLLSGQLPSDREALVAAFKSALEWVAQHAMLNKIAVADLKSVLRSARRHRLLSRHECDTLEASAIVSSVFSDARFAALVSKVNALRADLGALELHLKRELAKLDSRVTHVEKRVERAEVNVNAVAQDLKRLREALRTKQRREAVFEALKVVLSMSTMVAGGVGGALADLLAGMWDLGSISELSVGLLPAAVAGSLDTEALGEKFGEFLEKGREQLAEALARRGAGEPDDLVKEWIAAEREWQQFTCK